MSRNNAQAVVAPAVKSAVFIAFSLVVLLVISLELGGDFRFVHDREQYSGVFSDTSGLKGGDSVRIAGVQVGTVQDVELVDARTATVGFTVDRTRPIPADAQLTIRYLNLTGDRYLEIAPGRGQASAAPLSPGGTIPLAQTAPALDLDVLLAGFDPLFEGLAPEQINNLTNDMIQVLQGQGGTFESILQRIASLTNTLADRDAVIGRVVDNLNTVLGTLDSPRLGETVERLQVLVSGLAADRGQLGNGLESTQRLVSSVDQFLDRSRGPLRDTVDQVQRVTNLTNDGREKIDEVLSMLPGAYLRVSRVASRGAMYSLFICSVRVKTTGPDGQPLYSPTVGPSDNVERCRDENVAPLETPEQRAATESDQQNQAGG